MKKRIIITLTLIVALVVQGVSVYANGLTNIATDSGDTLKNGTNRYNVVVVLDASNSMNGTDPNGYRFEAIGLFINLLTSSGNYIGNVVFSNEIIASQDVIESSNQGLKDDFMTQLRNTPATGYTNIGAGLNTAVDMLNQQGDASLPSVILFLSDGNTEMPNDKQYNESLEQKADAIQKARESGIQIYSVCLNANNYADTSEMSQIAEATGGQFKEVVTPEDLVGIFNIFYNLIYGTATIEIDDEKLPDSGVIEKEFALPSFGVEEVNIIVYGLVDNVEVFNPGGTEIESISIQSDTYTIVKFSDVEEGMWKLRASGNPGTQIKINMVYNTDLAVNVDTNGAEDGVAPEDMVTISATLESEGIIANQDSQYNGYSATLQVMDSYRNILEEDEMQVKNGKFVSEKNYEEGTYYYKVIVTGNYLNKESAEIGPVVVDPEIAENRKRLNNTPPVPIKTPIVETKYIIPFKENEYNLDLTTLAKDAEDQELVYEIISSSFIENRDYEVQNNKLKLTNFSLRKGAFTIRAYDTYGAFCDIEVIIKSINVGILTLIGVGIVALLVLLGVGIGLWYWLSRRLRGTLTVRAVNNGVVTTGERKNGSGRFKLSRFQVDNIGLDYSKSYIQATGKNYVYLITNVPVNATMGQGQSKKIMVRDNIETTVYAQDANRTLSILYKSNIKRTRPGGSVGGRRKQKLRKNNGPQYGGGYGTGRPGNPSYGRPGGSPYGAPGSGPRGSSHGTAGSRPGKL